MSEIADRTRSQRQHWAAPGSSHDRVVRIARVVLPAGIGILAAFLAIAPLTMDGDISFVLAKDKVEMARERMRVTSAVYRGADSKGQPFQLSAGSAVQATSRDPVVKLSDMSARIQLDDGPATLDAGQGRYDMDSERVAVDGPVRFRSADGYQLATSDVTVDMKSRRMASRGAVTGQMPLGDFSANRMNADLAGRTVTLDGRARLRIVQRSPR
ncbi:MAG: LPS export ABC transporter periplasmic protein LptC [Sphingomonas sp. SCN 67-18]|uniref:LPS export ABC transporter periplasmic protein LptC n=1 Tax=uncultured Sphingomonas sp. TaxID=158754 RepID=UPI00086C17A5|nr:LPS export ABC transporter periplasmic protein LptC [Sphingomonas sp. SCN 67-18]ODU21989.1 MAG: LPS export ABC transporter periplasmic protein LptC [Sphingomonas sp. SCN 67-18]